MLYEKSNSLMQHVIFASAIPVCRFKIIGLVLIESVLEVSSFSNTPGI